MVEVSWKSAQRREAFVKLSGVIAAAIAWLGVSLTARAETAPAAEPYSGGFLERSTLTGDWWDARNELAAKGITFDANVTQIEQGVTTGGKSGVWAYGGRGNLTTAAIATPPCRCRSRSGAS